MKIDVIQPSSQFAVPNGSVALCLTQLTDYAVIGTTRGQVLAYHVDRLNHPPIENLVSKAAIIHLFAVDASNSVLAISNLAVLLTLEDGAFSQKISLLSSTGARLAVCTPTHIVLAVKKALIVYTHSGDLVAQLSVKDKVRALSSYDSSHIVVASSAALSKLSLDSFKITDIHIDKSLLPSSYFGSSYFDVLACETYIILFQDALVVFLDKQGNQTRRINLVEKPIAAGLVSPIYMVIIYGSMIEVYDRTNGIRLQVIQSTKSITCGSVTPTNLLVSMNRCLSYFSVYSLDQQIDHCMLISGRSDPTQPRRPQNDLLILGLDMATRILQRVVVGGLNFGGSQKDKFMAIRDKYEKKALILFNHYHKYHDLLVDICSPWLIPVRTVLHLFPDFLNAALILDFEKADDESLPRSLLDIRNVTEHEAIYWRNAKNSNKPKINEKESFRIAKEDESQNVEDRGYEKNAKIEPKNGSDSHVIRSTAGTSLTKVNSTSFPDAAFHANPSETYAHFADAVTELIVYLTDQRRIHLNFLRAPYEVHEFRGFRLSAHDLYNVENLPVYLKNTATAIDTSLFLCYYYVKPTLLGPFLRLGNNHCDSAVVTRILLKEPQLTSEMLDFYFTRELDGEALKTLQVIAESESPEHCQASQLTVKYLQKLDSNKLDVVFEGAAWLFEKNPMDISSIGRQVFMNDTTACEGYDLQRVFDFIKNRASGLSLQVEYLEWALFENMTVLHRIRASQLYCRMSTRLAIRYIQDNSDRSLSYLEGTTEYDPVKVLACVTDNCANNLLISALLYERCGEHAKALDILYTQLGDLDRAMEFCQERYKECPKIGSELFHQLLDQILAGRNANEAIANVATLLEKHGLHMDVQQVLLSLPDSFPLSRLQDFILSQHNHKCGSVSDMQIQANLLRQSTNTMYCEKVLERARCVNIDSVETTCNVCHERLGSALLAVRPRDDQLCHYSCVELVEDKLRGSARHPLT